MKILMTGGTGLVGNELGQLLSSQGHSLVVISRNKHAAQQRLTFKAEIVEFDLATKALDLAHFDGVDCIINLAGESIDGRWTAKKKQQIKDSRVNITQNLLKNCPSKVSTLISASAQGLYGDSSDSEFNEDSKAGSGFLAEVCKEWEASTEFFKGRRKVILRIGLVLSKKGGALPKLISLFRKNLGAVLGSGRQWMSWISLRDLVYIFSEAVNNNEMSGVYNAVNEAPVTNTEFTEVLCDVLDSIKLPPAPAPIIKTVLGEMSTLVLGSLKVFPSRLIKLNFQFKDNNLKKYLEEELHICKNGNSYFYAEQFVERDINEVFRFFSDAYNLEKITPEFLNFKIEKISTPEINKGTLIDYKLKIHGFPAKWRTEIDVWEPPYRFVDCQLKGPYSFWYHTHSFESVNGGTLMKDTVQYRVPMAGLGRMLAGSFIESDIEKIFSFRRKSIFGLL